MRPLVPWKNVGAQAPAAARLLAGARRTPAFDPAARERVAARLAAATGVAPAPAPPAFGLTRLLLVSGVIVAAFVGAGLLSRRAPPSPPPPAPVASSVAAPAVLAPVDAPSIGVNDLPDAEQVRVPVMASAEPRVMDPLSRELALVDGARSAADPTAALALLDRHAREFPNGQLTLDRDVMRVDALVRLGRVAEAHTAADRVVARAPGTPYAERVNALLEGPR